MKWENISDEKRLSYVLRNDSVLRNYNEIKLSFDKKNSYYDGECFIGHKAYILTRKGFWKTFINLKDTKGNVIAELVQERWYSRKWRLQIGDHNYYIKYQNNPLFELIVEDYASETVIKYRLIADDYDTDVELEITSEPESKDDLDIVILIGWYIILPICIENTVGIRENI